MTSQKINGMIEITIKPNDAFRVIQTITRDAVRDLEDHIVNRLLSERLITKSPEDCGLSLDDIAENNGMTIHQLIVVLFPSVKHRDEIPELSKNIILVCDGAERPCPECGCELEQEPDGEWMDIKCSNTACDFRDCTEPDHDVFPGGYSFKKEF